MSTPSGRQMVGGRRKPDRLNGLNCLNGLNALAAVKPLGVIPFGCRSGRQMTDIAPSEQHPVAVFMGEDIYPGVY